MAEGEGWRDSQNASGYSHCTIPLPMAKKQKKKEGKETEIMFKFIVQKHFSSKEDLNLDFEKPV